MDRDPLRIPLEKRFQLFLDSAKDYALFFMLPDNKICEWSRGAELIIGYSAEEAVQLSGDVLFTAEDKQRGIPEREREIAVRDGEANDERWHLRKDGSQFFAVGRMVALKDSAGQLQGFAKIIRDATPRKKLEEMLHASETQLHSVFAQAPWGIMLTDLKSRILQINTALTALTGFSADFLEGKELVALSVEEDREKIRRALDVLFSEKKDTVSFSKRLRRADGGSLWVQNSITVLRDREGRPFALLDLCHDISVLKLSEEELAQRVQQRTGELEQKSQQMEAFCYTIAHDLRAPLRSISGYASLLKEDFAAVLPAVALNYVQKIQTSAGRLEQLILDLLDYTRVQQVSLALEEVDLTAIATKAAEQTRGEYGIAHLEIEITGPLGKIKSDPTALEHVLMNLLSNAVKFHRPNVAPKIRVYAEEKPNTIRVWVEDNGVGIDSRYRERAFEMFERLHTDLNVPGTGIGLAIVSTAIVRLGGTRGFEPNQPHGSRFWFELPK